MSKKSQRAKKTKSSLLKFLNNRKSLSVALGICLAIAASTYIATAKFSASSIITAPGGAANATITNTGKKAALKVTIKYNKSSVGIAGKDVHFSASGDGSKLNIIGKMTASTNLYGDVYWEMDVCKATIKSVGSVVTIARKTDVYFVCANNQPVKKVYIDYANGKFSRQRYLFPKMLKKIPEDGRYNKFTIGMLNSVVITDTLTNLPNMAVKDPPKQTTAQKAKSAVKKVTSMVKKKPVTVNTKQTTKEKMTFSEILPPEVINMTKVLTLQLKDAVSGQSSKGPVKLMVLYKECTKGGCGGSSGSDLKTSEVEITANSEGSAKFVFGVVNIPQVKTSSLTKKKTTFNRYFLTFSAISPSPIRRVYVVDASGNKKEINIGGYPFATKSEANAQKFQIYGGKPFPFSVKNGS